MEKGESKVNLAELPQPTGRMSGRVIVWLAASVVLLSLAFIVFSAIGGSVLLNKQQQCDYEAVTTPKTAPPNAEAYDIDVPVNKTMQHEHVIVDKDSQTEYIVARDSTTGHVQSVVTVQYEQEKTTMYSAKNNLCFIARGHLGRFEDSVDGLRADQHGPGNVELNFEIEDRVSDSEDIPVEMSAFCTKSNTYWLVEKSQEESDARSKRQASCPWLCEYLAFLGYSGGVPVYYYVWWVDRYSSCSSPCSGFYEYLLYG